MTKYIAIIGGGVIGICTALQLQREGFSVCIIDPDKIKKAASYGNAGNMAWTEIAPLAMPGVIKHIPKWLFDPLGPLSIRPSYAATCLPWMLRLLAESHVSRIKNIVATRHILGARNAIDFAELIQSTCTQDLVSTSHCIKLYRNESDWRADSLEWILRKDYAQNFEILYQDALHLEECHLSKDIQLGIKFPERKFIIDPAEFLIRLKEKFRSEGGITIKDKVLGFQFRGARVSALDTQASGIIHTDSVVIAAGAHSAKLANKLCDRVPLESERGYHLMVKGASHLLRGTITNADVGLALVPMRDGLRITGTVEFAGLQAPPDPRQADRLFTAAAQLIPELMQHKADLGPLWLGHRPSFPDSLPLIARASHYSNVFYGFGHNHMGMSWAATTAKQLLALIQGHAIDDCFAGCRMNRFNTTPRRS